MALKIELEGLSPGTGRLRVSGAFDEPESVALAIQRNDGRYLGAAEVWQATPHWHPQFSARSDGAALTLDIGAEIIDGVIAVGGRPLRVVLRIDGDENDGILRVKGELIGSGAAAANQEHCDPPDSAAVFAADAVSEGAAPVADTGDGAGDEDPEGDQRRRAGVGFWLGVAPLPRPADRRRGPARDGPGAGEAIRAISPRLESSMLVGLARCADPVGAALREQSLPATNRGRLVRRRRSSRQAAKIAKISLKKPTITASSSVMIPERS